MKVRMRTLAAGPGGVLRPGQVVDLPEKQARALIQGGYAEEVIPSDVERGERAGARPAPTEAVRETAVLEVEEQAVTPKGTRKRGPKSSGK